MFYSYYCLHCKLALVNTWIIRANLSWAAFYLCTQVILVHLAKQDQFHAHKWSFTFLKLFLKKLNRGISQMWACHKPAGSHNRLLNVLYVFEHKMQYILIWAPYACIVVFWHILWETGKQMIWIISLRWPAWHKRTIQFIFCSNHMILDFWYICIKPIVLNYLGVCGAVRCMIRIPMIYERHSHPLPPPPHMKPYVILSVILCKIIISLGQHWQWRYDSLASCDQYNILSL